MSDQQIAVPNFEVPNFDNATVAFGAPRSAYLPASKIPDEFYSGSHPMCRVASSFFFEGGRLADHGLRFKAGIDRSKAMGAVQGLLCSFEPPHEIKIGTVGVALANWCEPIPSEDR